MSRTKLSSGLHAAQGSRVGHSCFSGSGRRSIVAATSHHQTPLITCVSWSIGGVRWLGRLVGITWASLLIRKEVVNCKTVRKQITASIEIIKALKIFALRAPHYKAKGTFQWLPGHWKCYASSLSTLFAERPHVAAGLLQNARTEIT